MACRRAIFLLQGLNTQRVILGTDSEVSVCKIMSEEMYSSANGQIVEEFKGFLHFRSLVLMGAHSSQGRLL